MTTATVPTSTSRLDSVLYALADRGWKSGGVAGWTAEETARYYESVIGAGLTIKNLPLACVLIEYAFDRKPDTVRGLLYAVVSAGWIPDTSDKSYGRVQRLLNDLRKKRVIPFEWIVDNIRETMKPPSWSGLDDFADVVREAYRKDFWAHLPEYVCIIVEKDTVAGRIYPITEKYNVALHPLRGYSSTSFTYSSAEQWDRIEKPITAYYIGDHDPSGRDIERSIRNELAGYVSRPFEWKRLAVEPEHFDEFDIIALDPKVKDRRFASFCEQYGPRCAEVEAIPANVLRQMVEKAITSHLPMDQWDRLKRVEEQERATWAEVMERVGGAE